MSPESQVFVPKMISGCADCTSTSIFLPFFLALYKLITRILNDFLLLAAWGSAVAQW